MQLPLWCTGVGGVVHAWSKTGVGGGYEIFSLGNQGRTAPAPPIAGSKRVMVARVGRGL